MHKLHKVLITIIFLLNMNKTTRYLSFKNVIHYNVNNLKYDILIY